MSYQQRIYACNMIRVVLGAQLANLNSQIRESNLRVAQIEFWERSTIPLLSMVKQEPVLPRTKQVICTWDWTISLTSFLRLYDFNQAIVWYYYIYFCWREVHNSIIAVMLAWQIYNSCQRTTILPDQTEHPRTSVLCIAPVPRILTTS